MRIKTHAKVIATPLSLAPLVDVVFLLLVFFMISSSLVFWPGTRVDTKVQLPRSRTNSMSIADKLVLTMTRTGLLFLGDNPISWDDVERRLREEVRKSQVTAAKQSGMATNQPSQKARSPLVVLRADKSISYGKIVELMSLARSLGLGVYLVTDYPVDTRGKTLSIRGGKFD